MATVADMGDAPCDSRTRIRSLRDMSIRRRQAGKKGIDEKSDGTATGSGKGEKRYAVWPGAMMQMSGRLR